MASMRIVTDPRCLEHAAPLGYPEKPERLRGVLAALRRDGFEVVETEPTKRPREAVEALHDGAYVERFARAVERGDGLLDSADNPLSAGTFEASLGAVEAILAGADWVMAEAGRKAMAAVRPPGHHAEEARAMGFCFFNGIAVAAQDLIRRQLCQRVAIFDFDVHHGNGTQHLFEERSDVFFVSTHQFPFYPGTGAAEERGQGAGTGTTLNLPMAAGAGDEEYGRVFEESVFPALRRFAPDVLLVSAGFDAWRGDPLGGMRVSAEGFADWGRRLAALSAELCEGRLMMVLEGGYDLDELPELVSGCCRAMLGN
ncbi:MAG: histone deacetylase [Acidobacteriota bacterium]